jgi:hypothetical protein
MIYRINGSHAAELTSLCFLASLIKFGDGVITRAAYRGHFDIIELLLNSKVCCAFILILKATLAVIQLIILVTVRPSRYLPLLR